MPHFVLCVFCGAESTARCSWRVPKPAAVRADTISVGDVLVTPGTKLHVPVVEITTSRALDRTTMYLYIYVERRKGKTPERWHYLKTNDQHVTVLRPGFCDQPTCENHHVERWEGRHYCMDHWSAWEVVR